MDIIGNGKFNPHLQLNARNQVRISLRKQVLSLKKLKTPDDRLPLLVQQDTAYVNSSPILGDPRIHNDIFQGLTNLSQAALHAPELEQEGEDAAVAQTAQKKMSTSKSHSPHMCGNRKMFHLSTNKWHSK